VYFLGSAALGVPGVVHQFIEGFVTSVWCAYAAAASVIILYYFWTSHEERPFRYGYQSQKCSAAVLLSKAQHGYDMANKKTASFTLKLTESEQDLLSQLEQGYQLETDSLGANPVLRRLKDGEVIRPLSAKASTVKALEERGLIHPGKGRDPLTIVWRLKENPM
jgi:hypothetical protein